MTITGKTMTGTPLRGVDAQPDATATSATELTVVFDMSVTLHGTPRWTADGEAALSAEQTAADTIVITFPAGTFTSGADVTIPQYDAAIRTQTGGFARAATFPVAAPD